MKESQEFDRMHQEVVRRGEEAMRTEPQAQSAHYDRESNRIVLALKNDTTFIFPCAALPD